MMIPPDLSHLSAKRRSHQKASDQELAVAYREMGSVWLVAEKFGMIGQSVHERLARLGIANSKNTLTEAEIDRLKEEYWIAADTGKLAELAKDMGRAKTYICHKARELGLTDPGRNKPFLAKWKYVGEESARLFFEQFKASSLNLGQWCKSRRYDDLGFATCMKRHFPDEWEHVIELKQTKQTKYRYGRQFEYKVRDELKALGYFALRSPASRTPIDVLAIKPGAVLMVQCKRGGNLRVSEWNVLFDLAISCGALPVLASLPVPKRGTVYEILVGRKDGSKRRQPKELWAPR